MTVGHPDFNDILRTINGTTKVIYDGHAVRKDGLLVDTKRCDQPVINCQKIQGLNCVKKLKLKIFI